jgi:EAL domain-containing protein (putative c-di-GMP-specific phosphodiesterase class I)
LQKLPLDRLKIDRDFIKDLPGQDCQAIAALIISLGARLGLKTIEEGSNTKLPCLILLVECVFRSMCAQLALI